MYLEASDPIDADRPESIGLRHRLAAPAALGFAATCLILGLLGSAFDEASAADALLPVGVPHVVSWNWALDHVVWFAAANTISGIGLLLLSGWVSARRQARIARRRVFADRD